MLRVPQTIVCSLRELQRVQVRLRSTATAASAQDVRSDAASPAVDWDTARPYSEIPGPKPLPVIGNTFRFLPGGMFSNLDLPDVLDSMNKMYGQVAKLGGIGRPDMIFLFDAEDYERVVRNEGTWPFRMSSDILEYYYRRVRKNVLASLVVSQGEEWQTYRTAVNQVMMQPKNTKQYVEPIGTVTQEFVDRMREIRDDKLQMPDDFAQEIAKWSLESITYVALDTRLGLFQNNDPNSEAAQMVDCAHKVFECMYKLDFLPSPWKYVSTPAFREFKRSMDYFTSVASRHVDAAMARLKTVPSNELQDRPYSVLENLLLRSEDPNVAVSMALDMLLAGIDTTSTTSSTVFYQLANNPDKQKKLQEELDRVIPDPNQPITKEQLEEMKYVKACIKETMRIMPIIIGTVRRVAKDTVVHGYQMPKDTILAMSGTNVTMDARYFPRPSEFLPERWLPGNDDIKCKYPFAFLPFGFGPRMCVGKRFADLEIETLTAKVFRNFELQWNQPPAQTMFKMLRTFKSPLKFTVKDRV